MGPAGLAVLCAIAALAINPIANRAPTDDAPIVAADLMLVALAALAMMACAAVFAGLLLGAALVGLAHGGVVIAGTQDAHVLEGDWQPDGVLVLISFPTVEGALAWYHSEEYRPALEIRKGASRSRLLIFGD